MCRDDRECHKGSIEPSRRLAAIENDARTSAVKGVPQTSLKILRDLGMSDKAIAEYFDRFSAGKMDAHRVWVLGDTAHDWSGEWSKRCSHEFEVKPA